MEGLIIMAKINVRKREMQWWMENSNELEFINKDKLNEAYDPSRLKPGTDGRNGPDVRSMYASKGNAKFDKLGAGDTGASKPKKGDGKQISMEYYPGEVEIKDSVKRNPKKVVEAFGGDDEDMVDDDMMDDEVPPEMEDFGDDEGFTGEDMEGEGEEIVDDIRVEIGGHSYMLIPASEQGEEEAEEHDDFGGDMEDEHAFDDGMDVGAESDDVENSFEDEDEDEDEDVKKFPESKKRKAVKKVSENAKKIEYVRKLLKMKNFAESKLQELFTGDYVISKQGLVGLDMKSVAGDKNFAVVAPAFSGKQYTVTDSKSEYEPGSDAKGQTAGKVQKPAASKKEAFKKWLDNQRKFMTEDEDAGKTSADFNANDVADNNAIDDDFPGLPEEMGKEDDMITQTSTQSEGTNRNKETLAKLEAIRKARQARRVESAKPKVAKVEKKLDETLDFKTLISGGYSKSKKING